MANVAVLAARAGGDVALAGGAGDDAGGGGCSSGSSARASTSRCSSWSRAGRRRSRWCRSTRQGEPSYEIYGEGIATVVHALRDRVEQAVDGSAALFLSSNTLVGDEERAVTMRARELALEHVSR